MIDIKKEDIGIQLFSHEMQPAYYLGIKTIFKEKQQAEQLKQQILQDHKDAKKLRKQHEIQKDAWKQYQKYEQIVKRLEVGLSQWKMNGSIPAWIVYELKKILEEKK